jgi:hypothetical protein
MCITCSFLWDENSLATINHHVMKAIKDRQIGGYSNFSPLQTVDSLVIKVLLHLYVLQLRKPAKYELHVNIETRRFPAFRWIEVKFQAAP